jgi:cell shape-determining protein MreC
MQIIHDMVRRQINVSRGTLFAALLLGGIVLLILPQNITRNLNFLFRDFVNVFRLHSLTSETVFKRAPITSEFVPRSEYDKLWKEYKNTHAQMMDLREQCEDLARFRIALPKSGSALATVEVIDISITSFGHELFVNKGRLDGLETGQYVMGKNENSIIGTVHETTDNRAKIRLATDASHRIEVLIWREGKTKYIRGQMRGDGKMSCKIPLVEKEYDVKVGDTVYAADRPGFLEVPIIIGEVCEVKPDDTKPLLWDITVKPVEEFSAITDAAIILANPPIKNDN